LIIWPGWDAPHVRVTAGFWSELGGGP